MLGFPETRAYRRRRTQEESGDERPYIRLREVAVTLPDGAVRRYPPASTAADVAADISKSLGKAALAAAHRRPALRPR